MNAKTALLIITILLLLGLVLFLWHSNTQVDRQLILAEQESLQAQAALAKAEDAVEAKRLHLAQVAATSAFKIEQSEAKICKLQKEAAESREKAGKLTADNQALKEHINQLASAEVELDPLPAETILDEGAQLYPEKDFHEASIWGNESGLALVQLVITEVRDRRELDQNNEEIITECQDQTARLEAVIKEQEIKFQAAGESYREQGEYVSLLETEAVTYREWGQSLQRQVDLYGKKGRWVWLDKVEKLLALYGAIKIVSDIK